MNENIIPSDYIHHLQMPEKREEPPGLRSRLRRMAGGGFHRRDFSSFTPVKSFEILFTTQMCNPLKRKFASQNGDWERFSFFKLFFEFAGLIF